MRRRILAIVALAWTGTLSASSPPSPSLIGCAEYGPRLAAAAAPRTAGPLTLVRLACLGLPSSPFSGTAAAPSPDANAAFTFNEIEGLRIVGIVPRSPIRHFEGRVGAGGATDARPFAWANGSRAVWGVRQDLTKPSGFALGGKRPTLFALDGTETRLPALTNPAGELDELYWVGGDGMAVAAFGSLGAYYKPERPNPRPTIAIVDARRGRILQAVALKDIPGLGSRRMIARISTVLDRRGRVHALISIAPKVWVQWNQGEAPRIVRVGSEQSWAPFALAPDFRRVLIMKSLSATGMICEHNPKCPRPTPVSGAIAELRDIATGKIVWSIRGTANYISGSRPPVISPDGRYALISMPQTAAGEPNALVSMADGRILQELPQGKVGFLPDGRTAWISNNQGLAFYRVTR